MSTIEERLEVKLIHNQALLVAIAKGLIAMFANVGQGYAANELKRAIVQARPYEGD